MSNCAVFTMEDHLENSKNSGILQKSNQSKVLSKDSDDDNDVSIPVLKNVVASKYTIIGKLIWMAILLTCSIIMLINIVNRIKYYTSLPLDVNIRAESQRGDVYYPDITVCHANYFRQSVYVKIQQEIGNISGIEPSKVRIDDILQHMDIMELFQRVAFQLTDIVKLCQVFKSLQCTQFGEWRPLITVAGMCYTFSQNKPLNVSGAAYGMKIIIGNSVETSTEDNSWKVLLHDHRSTPKASVFTDGFTVMAYQMVNVKLNLRKLSSRSTPNIPCSNVTVANCKVQCLSDFTLKKANCRLPFMEDVDAPYCTPPNHKIADDMLNRVLKGIEPSCSCIEECVRNKYDISINSLYKQSPPNIISTLNIYFEDLMYLSIREDYCYEFVSLLSDLGGTLGFFMGMSLLTIAELMETLVVTLNNSVRKQSITKKPAINEAIDDNELFASIEDVSSYL